MNQTPTPARAVGYLRAIVMLALTALVQFVGVATEFDYSSQLATAVSACLLIGAARAAEVVLFDLRQTGNVLTEAGLRVIGLALLGGLVTGGLDALNLFTDTQVALFVPIVANLLRTLEAQVLDAAKEAQAGLIGGRPART